MVSKMIKSKINDRKKIKFLEDFFIKKEGKQILKNIKKTNLIKAGYLDSMDVITLASLIQKKFKTNVDLSKERVLKSFEKFNTIIKLIN